MLKGILKDTFFYGIATVLPRILTVLLTPFYVSFLPHKSDFGIYSSLMVYMIFGNVILSYGMETAYFRFINKYPNRLKVERTALTSILLTVSLFLITTVSYSEPLSEYLHYKHVYVLDVIFILCIDALLVIPFAKLRNEEKSIRFTIIKTLNVLINILLNILFLVILKDSKFLGNDKIHLILLALLIPSFLTLLALTPIYRTTGIGIDKKIWKKMLRYGYPILIAGIAFAINEGIDKILLRHLLPVDIADEKVGIYSACYKLGALMMLFTTAFKLGIEPFFFKQIGKKNTKETYGKITYYFILLGSIILLFVCTHISLIKHIIVPKSTYWEGLWIVPFILIANLFLGIYYNLSVWYKIKDKTIYGAIFSIIGALITLVLNFVLIPYIGFKGSAIATLSAYTTMTIISFFVGRYTYRITYPIKKILLILGSAILFSLLSFYTFGGDIYIGIVIFLIFIIEIYIIEKPLIKRLIKSNYS